MSFTDSWSTGTHTDTRLLGGSMSVYTIRRITSDSTIVSNTGSFIVTIGLRTLGLNTGVKLHLDAKH